jgi:hypothetical protein
VPTSGPLHPRRPDGSEVDATFELSTVPVIDLVYHHKARGRDDPRAVNTEYHEGLELILAKLSTVSARILGISVDSSVARELDPADRELQLQFPIELSPETNARSLRLQITRAQKPIARRAGAKPQGGNDQKRIRLTLTWNDRSLTYDRLLELLAGTRSEASGPSREVIRNLLLEGTSADQISARYGGRRGPWLVALEEEAKLDREFDTFAPTPENVVALRDGRMLRWERIAVRVTGDPRSTSLVQRMYDEAKGEGASRRSYTHMECGLSTGQGRAAPLFVGSGSAGGAHRLSSTSVSRLICAGWCRMTGYAK